MKLQFFRQRKQERGELILVLGERPNFFSDLPGAVPQKGLVQTPGGDTPPKGEPAVEDEVAGMTLVPVTAETHTKLNLPADTTGLEITRLQPNTPAANCGLEKGDIILRINRSSPKNQEEAVDAILNHSREGKATLQVRKGDTTRNAVMNLK